MAWRRLRASPPGIVIISDADCCFAPGAIDALVNAAVSSQSPAQSLYLMDPPVNPRPSDGISAFAFLVKNLVRALGSRQLGIPCLLRGTGIAFPWAVICDAPLATDNLVEDLQLGIDLTFAGHPPVFCPEACVMGRLPLDRGAAGKQRRRWEHGHLRTITRTVLPTTVQALLHRRLDLMLLALDVAIPPLSLLVLMWMFLGAGLSALAWATGAFLPLVIWTGGTALLVVAILAAWCRFGRQVVSASSLAAIPSYVLAKIPLYLSYLFSPQREWIRTDRGPPANPSLPPPVSAASPPE